MTREDARGIARSFVSAEVKAGVVDMQAANERAYALEAALTAVPDLEPWVVVSPVAGGAGAQALGLANGRLYRVVAEPDAEDGLRVTTTFVESRALRLELVDTVRPAIIGPVGAMTMIEASISRTWVLSAEHWGEARVLTQREWPDTRWSGPGRMFEQMLAQLGLAQPVPELDEAG
jgi:hypothetical protein